MARVPHRRRREEEDLEQVRQKQLDEQVMEKKLLLRQQFNQKEESSRQQDGGQSEKRDHLYRVMLDGCYSRNLELRKRLDKSNRELILIQDHDDKNDILGNLRNVERPETSDQISEIQSSILSKSQISTYTPFNYFNIQRIQKQLSDVKEQYSQVENQMSIENQLTSSLLAMQDDIDDVKRRLGKKVQELKRIHQVLHTHFQNHDDVKDRYQFREQEASQVLDSTKKQIQNLSLIEQAYTLKVVERRKNRKKAIEREESTIGHVQVRLEEARKQNEKLTKIVEELLSQELIKKTRNDQFYFIGQYLVIFEELEKFFNKAGPDDIIVRYHKMGDIQDKHLDIQKEIPGKSNSRRQSFSPQSPSSRRSFSLKKTFSRQPSRNQTNILSKCTTTMPQREKYLCEIFLNNYNMEQFERSEIVQHIQQFYDVHQDGPNLLVDDALKEFSQLQVQQNSLQSMHKEKSLEQGDKRRIIESLVIQCDNLMVQYTQVEKIENDPIYNQNFDNQRVALDSGMIKVVKIEQNREKDVLNIILNQIFNCVFDEQLEPDLTTINKVRFQGTECSFENIKISHEFKLNEFFILNIHSYVSELLSRICYALVWLSEYTQMVPTDLDHRCIQALKKISHKDIQLWIPTYNPNGDQNQHIPIDIKQNLLQIFQQSTQKQEKRGSFVNILNRKRSQGFVKQNPTMQQTVNQSTQSLYHSNGGFLQMANPLNQQSIQKLPSQKIGSFSKMLNYGSSFNEDNTSETFKVFAQPCDNIHILNNEDSYTNESIRLRHYPKAHDEWKDLLRNDKLSSYFIKQDYSTIIENLNHKLEKNQCDNLDLIGLIYDSYIQIVFSASLSLQELLEFIFSNYSGIVKETHDMSHQTREDIKELQLEKERDNSNQIQVPKLTKKESFLDPKIQGSHFLRDMSQLAQQKQQKYLNSEDLNNQCINLDGVHQENDEKIKEIHLQFILDSNSIQRKNPILHKKLIGQALHNIDTQKQQEMVENYYPYSADINHHLSDNDYLDTERKHLKITLNKNQIDLQRQLNGLNVNKQSNSQINAACIDRFFVDINNFETKEIKQIYKSASLLQKITNLEMMNKSTDHLIVKKKVVEDQKKIAKKFHRETNMKVSTSYDKPNQLYQLRMKINIPELNQVRERKNRSLIERLKKLKQQKTDSQSLSPLRLPRIQSSQLITEKRGVSVYNSGMQIEEEPVSQVFIHQTSLIKIEHKNVQRSTSKFKKQIHTKTTTDSSRSIVMEKIKFPHTETSTEELDYFQIQHDMMNYHLDLSLIKMKTLLVDKEAANNYGFNLLRY